MDHKSMRRKFFKTEQEIYSFGAAIGLILFLLTFVGIVSITLYGVWDVVKFAGIISLALALMAVMVIGGGELAVKINRLAEKRASTRD